MTDLAPISASENGGGQGQADGQNRRMTRAGLRRQTSGLREQLSSWPGPWWLNALLALVVGLGTAVNSFRRVAASSGWHVVSLTFIGMCGAVCFLAWGTAAFMKIRDPARRTRSDSGTH